jgi:hypothetical protein
VAEDTVEEVEDPTVAAEAASMEAEVAVEVFTVAVEAGATTVAVVDTGREVREATAADTEAALVGAPTDTADRAAMVDRVDTEAMGGADTVGLAGTAEMDAADTGRMDADIVPDATAPMG